MNATKTRLRVISYNIQAAIGVQSPAHYVTRVHRQFLHVQAKSRTLKKIGKLIDAYDVACLQEIDLGGRRSNFESQIEALFQASSFSDAAYQENRIVRRISRHGNVILTRKEFDEVDDLKLPAKMGGRGAIIGKLDLDQTRSLTIVNLHLSLGAEDQAYQIDHLIEELEGTDNLVVCGDFNAFATLPHMQRMMKALQLKLAGSPKPTYPSWGPRHAIDHILVSRHIEVTNYDVVQTSLSDHLPLMAEIIL